MHDLHFIQLVRTCLADFKLIRLIHAAAHFHWSISNMVNSVNGMWSVCISTITLWYVIVCFCMLMYVFSQRGNPSLLPLINHRRAAWVSEKRLPPVKQSESDRMTEQCRGVNKYPHTAIGSHSHAWSPAYLATSMFMWECQSVRDSGPHLAETGRGLHCSAFLAVEGRLKPDSHPTTCQ